jgi:hypothetical protein
VASLAQTARPGPPGAVRTWQLRTPAERTLSFIAWLGGVHA